MFQSLDVVRCQLRVAALNQFTATESQAVSFSSCILRQACMWCGHWRVARDCSELPHVPRLCCATKGLSMLASRVNLRVICRPRVHGSENNSDPALIVATADRVNARTRCYSLTGVPT